MSGRFDDLRTADAGPPAVDPSLWPIDLTTVVAGNYAQPAPTILHRDDGQALIYPGEVNGIHGPSGEGKGWVALWAAVEQMRAGHVVVLVDLEDNAPSIVARLRTLGASDSDMLERLVYIRPTVGLQGLIEVEHLLLVVEERRPSLVIVDSLGEAFGLDGIDEDRDAEVGPWYRRVARRIAEAGPAVALVDHSTKANDNPLFPSGSKRKRAAITGASYLVTATKALVAGQGGRLRLTCAKDRHGTYRRNEAVADFVMTPTQTGGLGVRLYTPDAAAEAQPAVELAVRAAVRAARSAGRPLSLTLLTETMAIKSRAELKRAGIDLAVSRGLLVESTGSRNARLFTVAEDSEP
jgi:hypothetical protein